MQDLSAVHLFPTLRLFQLFLPEALSCAPRGQRLQHRFRAWSWCSVSGPTPDPLHLGLGLSNTHRHRPPHVIPMCQNWEPTPGGQSHLLRVAVPSSLSWDQHHPAGSHLTASKTQSPQQLSRPYVYTASPLPAWPHVPNAHCPCHSLHSSHSIQWLENAPGLLLPQHLHRDGFLSLSHAPSRSARLRPSPPAYPFFCDIYPGHTTYN